jgi:hypothetical protein
LSLLKRNAEMNKNIMGRNFNEVIEEACHHNSGLRSRQSKTRAFFEAYAFSQSLNTNTLLVIHVCDSYGEIRPELEYYLMKVYPLSDGSRGSYHSDIRHMVRAIQSEGNVDNEITDCLLSKQIPEYMESLLPYVPRKCRLKYKHNFESEERLKAPYTAYGELFLLACLEVHERFALESINSLLVEHLVDVRKARTRMVITSERQRALGL